VKGNEVKEYKKGIVKQITHTGYIIQIAGDLSVKSMDGTLCNRNEADVDPVTVPMPAAASGCQRMTSLAIDTEDCKSAFNPEV